MKAYRKALVILGSIGLFAGPSHAQAQPVPQPAEVAAASPCIFKNAGDQSTTFSACAAIRKQVEFTEYKNLKKLAKQNPELADIAENYGPQSPDAVLESKGKFAKIGDGLYIFRFEDSMNCGSLGCSNILFAPTHDGYAPVLENTTSDTIYYAASNGNISLFFCGFENEMVEWKQENDSFDFSPVPLQDGYTRVSCDAPPSQADKPKP